MCIQMDVRARVYIGVLHVWVDAIQVEKSDTTKCFLLSRTKVIVCKFGNTNKLED